MMGLLSRLEVETKMLLRYILAMSNRLVRPAKPALTTTGIVRGPSVVPSWFEAALTNAARFEPKLSRRYITPDVFREHRIPATSSLGERYRSIVSRIEGLPRPTHVLVAPWLSIGGSDEATIQFMQLLEPQARVLLILTASNRNSWLSRIPENIAVVDVSDELNVLGTGEQELLVARLLTQIAPTHIHIINSDVGWRCIANYGRALSSVSRVFVSLFCDEVSASGEIFGYAQWYLRDSYPHIEGILVDNRQFPLIWSERLGIPLEKFHYVPLFIDLPAHHRAAQIHSRPQVLWMGREVTQKQPEIVSQIAAELPAFDFHMYGISETSLAQVGRGLDNLIVYDQVASFADVQPDKFDVFMNTSRWDGLPYVIKQAAAHKLPIVSSAVGGIQTFLNDSNSVLIRNPSVAMEYVGALKMLLSDRVLADQNAESCYNSLEKEHSRSATEALLRSLRYLPD